MNSARIQFLNDLVTDARCSYWASVSKLDEASDASTVVIALAEEEGDGRFELTLADIERGLVKLIDAADSSYFNAGYSESKDRLQRLLDSNGDGDYDALDADAVVQTACFGEVIYG